MFDVDILNSFFKDIFINLCISYIFIKIINYKDIKRKEFIYIVSFSIFIAIIYANLLGYAGFIFTNVICLLSYAFFISSITKTKPACAIVVMLLAVAITFSIFVIATIISGCIFKTIFVNIKDNNTIGLFMIVLIEALCIYYIFKIKRFKNGFSFIKNENYINNIGIVGMICSGIAIIIYSLIGVDNSSEINQNLYAGIVLVIISVIIWIRREITLSYKRMLQEETVEQLEKDLENEKKKNERAIYELETIAEINHKYSTRISAIESYIKTISQSSKFEFSEEFVEGKKLIENLSKEYNDEIYNSIKSQTRIDVANNLGIDCVISYLQKESNKNSIDLVFENNVCIEDLINKYVSQSELETLLADHIKDSIIAINSGNNSIRRIKVVLEKLNELYEIRIYDTGIEFEIQTLLGLGISRITTHKDDGGSGIGFMTTFETLKKSKASLIIEEYNSKITDYTKAIIIRFNNKGEYIIRSYRAEKIRAKSNDNRIVIEDLL